ncbi:cora-like Mg2+ transporter protein-domain-containing protein [Suillus fuscotomentosus]|uniref:Cora-like Mg2+ transporter protein-domain-containing protein n=1 Tax=Suillus fuscotomentosus TaxID=1912939 RepID=A0AAD4HIA8_9AGAM|nr:cora-like Mg2+ transporter protein-domain-containing protein [Suillus fuscotomentosus]KAG1898680.1 cora-like Mg2+ transporter protein-domain-containing protein [Suillus fuscotomentosus]
MSTLTWLPVIRPSWINPHCPGWTTLRTSSGTGRQIQYSENKSSTIYWMDVRDSEDVTKRFTVPDMGENDHGTTKVPIEDPQNKFWKMLEQKRSEGIRVGTLFVDDLTSLVLRMLGTRYNIEPFFFTSSLNWIPSRYQEAPRHGEGDHVTITLPFLRSQQKSQSPTDPKPLDSKTNTPIDIQAPFSTGGGHMFFIDLLAIHMVRGKESTIISYHPESTGQLTSAKHLRSLIQLVGKSVYWQKIFDKSKDPTFLFLAFLWYALYEWDESLDSLYSYVSELELQVLHLDNIALTHDLHVLEVRLLHYQSLLHGFEVSVKFIETNPNPAMEVAAKKGRMESGALMKKECKNLLSEIDRLERRQKMLSSRLKNAMELAFAIVNTEDSRRMQRFTYLTIVFLPASFIASIFGMNVIEINNGTQTLTHYAVATVVLTLLTIYIIIMLQKQNSVHRREATLLQRAVWPILSLQHVWVLQYKKSLDDMA